MSTSPSEGSAPPHIPSGAPWGSPPTPLLPRWYHHNLPNVRLSSKIRAENPTVTTIGHLKAFWNDRSSPIGDPARRSLLYIANTYPPPPLLVVIPPEIGPTDILDWPLSVRTANSLLRNGVLKGSSPVCVEDLLAISGFGMASLLELMCVAEATVPVQQQTPAPFTATETSSADPDGSYERKDWREVADSLELLFAAANEFYGAITVSDALELDLTELALDLGLGDEVESYKIQDLTDIRILTTVVDSIRDLRTKMSERELTILEEYLFAQTRTTLEKLGVRFGVSRERIRQIKTRIADNVERCVGPEVDTIAATLRRRAGPVVAESDLRMAVDRLFEGEPLRDPAVGLTCRIVEAALGYDCVNGICAIGDARETLDGLRKRAVELADDVGLIDEEALRESLPDADWHRLFELLIERSGVVRIGHRLALRSTKKARAKAAILSIGRPATLDEIVTESGLPRANLGGLLSSIPGIARASKTKWGIEDWIEDEYEGIVAEIEQRIEEDGGATTLDRLVSELPEMFEVKESSVRALVATRQFVLRDGIVRLAQESEVTLRDVYEVVDGVTAEGWPYWSFRVHERYLKGYSLAGVPPEIADALGCPRNDSIRAAVSRPSGCGRISVNWHLRSLSGASVGYISTPLSRLGVAEGDRVSLVVVEPGVVEFRLFDLEQRGGLPKRRGRRSDRAGTTVTAGNPGSSALLERLKRRRQVL